MKVMPIFKNKGVACCPGFQAGQKYTAYTLYQCPPDTNTLEDYGLVVIDDHEDAIPAYEAWKLWDVAFVVVKE